MSAPPKIAVLVGVSDYKAGAALHLDGPAGADVPLMEQALVDRHGFAVVKLTNQAATRERAKSVLLASRAMAAGGMLVLYWSGHGTWAEDDRLRHRQAVLPYDYDTENDFDSFNLVFGRDLREWLTAPDVYSVAILDTCYAGGAVRALRGGPLARALPVGVPKTLPAPHRRSQHPEHDLVPRQIGLTLAAPGVEVLCLGACQDDQTSMDTSQGGAFTLALLAALATPGDNSWAGLIGETAEQLDKNGWEQDPALTGPARRFRDRAFVLKGHAL